MNSVGSNDSFMIPVFPGVVLGVTNVVEFQVTPQAKQALWKYKTMRESTQKK
jgi:hypothetical protein